MKESEQLSFHKRNVSLIILNIISYVAIHDVWYYERLRHQRPAN